MVETAITVLIIVGSMLLFAYWFRYTCLLILNAKTARDYAGEVAAANQLSFLEVQSLLAAVDAGPLDSLSDSLERDYTLIMGWTSNAGDEIGIEDRMLQMKYNSARLMFKTIGRISPAAARNSLQEMSVVISHFANALGERAAASA
jgi:hypothetical protein